MAFFTGSLFCLVCLVATTIAATTTPVTPPYYVITNAETPSLNRPGLTPVGQQRANACIPQIFSQLNIGLILSCSVDKEGKDGLLCPNAVLTATPLAKALGLNITLCATGEGSKDECVPDKLQAFFKTSTKSALIVWDSSEVDDLLEDANVKDAGMDIDDTVETPDVILTVPGLGVRVRPIATSMNCTGIDGPGPA
ncbi:hypothetical protein GGX14DRAFT_206659 [Mycena pura]|uniref:Uncharacterized protein n=1 Tax=Mycena pura TaxID=153505 RepID=A0AAD6Y3Q9_9AGAR|nr:hypothetical protein GGX14DRAFT_206659 [Mycena pura]